MVWATRSPGSAWGRTAEPGEADQAGDHEGHVEDAGHLLDDDQRARVGADRKHVGEPEARQRGEGQVQQVEPGLLVRAVGADERAGPEHLRRGVQVGERPGDHGERGAGGVELVAGDPVVVEQVADHRVGDEEVERGVHRSRAQHDPVGVGLDGLRDREEHGRNTEDQGHPAQSRGAAYGDHRGEDQDHLHHAEDGTARGRAVQERPGEDDEQLADQEDAGGVALQRRPGAPHAPASGWVSDPGSAAAWASWRRAPWPASSRAAAPPAPRSRACWRPPGRSSSARPR